MALFNVQFRLATTIAGGFLVSFSLATILAELVAPELRPTLTEAVSQPESHPTMLHSAVPAALLRGDLLANLALNHVAYKPEQNDFQKSPGLNGDLEPLTRRSLSFSPHASAMWLLLARIVSSPNMASEALKMSYLTSPATPEVVPARLRAFCKPELSADTDLVNLARSDVRLALISSPNLREVIADLYAQCSAGGKKALYQIISSLDVGFAKSLK